MCRRTCLVLLACVISACSTTSQVPKHLALDRVWDTNREGYVFQVGFFTEAEVRSRKWETARLSSRKTARVCDAERVVSRDVVWLDTAGNGSRCAKIVYAVACARPKPTWASSLAEARAKALQNLSVKPLASGCGAKDRLKRSPNRGSS